MYNFYDYAGKFFDYVGIFYDYVGKCYDYVDVVDEAQACEPMSLEVRSHIRTLSPQSRLANPAVHPYEFGGWVPRRNPEGTCLSTPGPHQQDFSRNHSLG